MTERAFPAQSRELEAVLAFVFEQLEKYNCSDRVRFQLEMAIEEIFVNIANYAYKSGEGEAVVRCAVEQDPIRLTIQFQDGGLPFNPLDRAAPDITKSAEERGIGGLGIHIVRETMDAVDYDYRDGKNILTLKKLI